MPKHEFGLMSESPRPGARFDKYEPEKYRCIAVDDDDIEAVGAELQALSCYWHTLTRPEKGLAHFGITIIPPTSLPAFEDIVAKAPQLAELRELIVTARREGRWIIHFGI